MSLVRRLRAVAVIAIVSALFWGVAVTLGFVGTVLITGTARIAGFPRFIPRVFLWGAGFGFVGGLLYAGLIAAIARQRTDRSISTTGAALAGAFGGLGVYVVGMLATRQYFQFALYPTVMCTLLGAATGAAILGTAKRGRLPSGDDPDKLPASDTH